MKNPEMKKIKACNQVIDAIIAMEEAYGSSYKQRPSFIDLLNTVDAMRIKEIESKLGVRL